MFNLFGNTSSKFSDILCDDLQNIINSDTNDYEIIDCRTPGEYHAGHIPDAKLMNIMDPTFRDKIKTLDPAITYYVYCRSGSRSMTACRVMEEAGLENLYNVKFGLMGWNGPLN